MNKSIVGALFALGLLSAPAQAVLVDPGTYTLVGPTKAEQLALYGRADAFFVFSPWAEGTAHGLPDLTPYVAETTAPFSSYSITATFSDGVTSRSDTTWDAVGTHRNRDPNNGWPAWFYFEDHLRTFTLTTSGRFSPLGPIPVQASVTFAPGFSFRPVVVQTPGPIAGAGFPVLAGLLGFAWWRRQRRSAR